MCICILDACSMLLLHTYGLSRKNHVTQFNGDKHKQRVDSYLRDKVKILLCLFVVGLIHDMM